MACEGVAGGRLVLASTGPVTRDFDDVRRFQDAAQKAVKRALAAGARNPLLVVHYSATGALQALFANYLSVAAAGALAQCHVPLQVREDADAPAWASATIDSLLVHGMEAEAAAYVQALEASRAVARDLCGCVFFCAMHVRSRALKYAMLVQQCSTCSPPFVFVRGRVGVRGHVSARASLSLSASLSVSVSVSLSVSLVQYVLVGQW